MRNELQAIADRHRARMKLVETPPGPPVIASVVAEVYGQPDHDYPDLLAASDTVRARLAVEPGVVDVDHVRKAPQPKRVFVVDKEKAALSGITTQQIAATLEALLAGSTVGLVHSQTERNPLRIELRMPIDHRTSPADLAHVQLKGSSGQLVPLAELGQWTRTRVGQMIYHKNLQRVAYVFGETAGRPPADVVVDVLADRTDATPDTPAAAGHTGSGWVSTAAGRPVAGRTFFTNGSGIAWGIPAGFTVDFAGEGEWKITLDVFRDLGLAFGAAMIGIYVLLVAQMRLVHGSRGRDVGHTADDFGRDARLLAVERLQCEARRRLSRSGVLHRNGHDRHDRPGGDRDPGFHHPCGLYPSIAR